MSKFTKGKWRASYEENKYIWSSDDQVLGELYFTTPEEPGETEANARLIAAAPEMYDYLKRICDFYHGSMIKRLHFKDGRGIKFSDIEALLAQIDGEDE